MPKFIEIKPNKTALIERSQEIIVDRIKSAIANKNRCCIALAGGSTPKPLYESLATEDLPWNKIHFFWGDERYVPADHSDSNQLMARQALLSKVAIAEENIHPMKTDSNDPQKDAARHEEELKEFFGIANGEFPVFDLILLGIGDDGHTASLFPHTDVLQEKELAIAVGNKAGEPRLTFTVPLINQADCVVFLVAGANKQSALAQIFAPDGDDMAYPARLIRPQGELWWLLDETAGEILRSLDLSFSS